MKVALVGLGAMGMGMACSMIRAKLDVYGVDLNLDNLNKINDFGAKKVATSAHEFADELDALVVVVVNEKQLNSVLFDPDDNGVSLAQKLPKGCGIMLCPTISKNGAETISQKLTSLGLLPLDAPISGGAKKAMDGEITVMASGSEEAFSHLSPILTAVSAHLYKVGAKAGLGTTVKIIHQLLAGVHIAVGAEAMAMAIKAGVDPGLMYEVVTNAAGNSWMFENRMKHVVEGDYSPLSMVDIFVKDLTLVENLAKSLAFNPPLASKALAMFSLASNMGFGKEDDSAVIKIFDGIDLPQKQ